MKSDGAGEFAVIDPTLQHELVLILDICVDELEEHPAFDVVVGGAWVIGRPIRQAAANYPVGIVATPSKALPGDWLTPWIDAAYVCTDRALESLRIS